MRKYIVKFYNERHFQPYKLVRRGASQGIDEKKIKTAMVHCYNKVTKEKKNVPDIELAKYVLNVARDNMAIGYEKEILTSEEDKHEARKWKTYFFIGMSFMGIVCTALFLHIKYGV